MSDFRHALLWHMEQHGTRIAELAKGAGVSVDTVKKIRTRVGASTSAENAAKIAAFYEKSVLQFIHCEDRAEHDAFIALLDLLTPAERQFVMAQLRGIIADRN